MGGGRERSNKVKTGELAIGFSSVEVFVDSDKSNLSGVEGIGEGDLLRF